MAKNARLMAKNATDNIKLKEVALNGALKLSDDQSIVPILQNPQTAGNSPGFSELINMRYTDARIRSVRGMTKINTSATTNIDIRNAFHYKKDFPSTESLFIISSRDASGANQKIYSSTTAIPSQGNISTLEWTATDTSSSVGTDMFSSTPNGMLSVCNGKDTLLWSGVEYPIALFHDVDPNGTYKYDWTQQLSNNLTDSENLATLHSVSGLLDSATMLLMHCDGTDNGTTFTDSSNTGHSITRNGGTVTKTAIKKFGTASAYFDGVDDDLRISDHANFDFSGGVWTIDFWIYAATIGEGNSACIYSQGTDSSNYMKLYAYHYDLGGYFVFSLVLQKVVDGSPTTIISLPGYISCGLWTHIAIVENGNTFRLYINGILSQVASSETRFADYTGNVHIGSQLGATNWFKGYIDEFRISNVDRWTGLGEDWGDNFDPAVSEYAASTDTISTIYVGSTLQLDGVKFYISVPNGTISTIYGWYWDGDGWVSVSNLIDGTKNETGIPLNQTGWVTFDSTVGLAKMKFIDGIPLYLYRFEVKNIYATTSLSQVTISAPMQQITDIWDGTARLIASFQKYTTTYTDYTTAVYQDSYTTTDESTYSKIGALTSSQYLVCGFTERMQGISMNLMSSYVNTNASIMTVSYWNGSAWTALAADDQTSVGGKSLSKSSTVSWQPPDASKEHKTVIAGTSGNKIALYYYKISFSATLSSDVRIYYIHGIPSSQQIAGYKFSLNHLNRLWLCNNTNLEPNVAVCSMQDTSQVFNGKNCIKQYFGDNTGLKAAVSLYYKYGSTVNSTALFFKENEVWALDGSDVSTLKPRLVSGEYGLVSPLTLQAIEAIFADGSTRRVAIWQSQQGIVMSDGTNIQEISGDIRGLFDVNDEDNYLGTAISDAYGFFDPTNNEYHWCLNNSTNKVEYVYSIKYQKWFEVNRSSATKLTGGILLYDSNGIAYTYGFGKTGYVWRLENGSSFDGDDIVSSFRTGDMALGEGSIFNKTTLKSTKMIAKTTGGSNSVTQKHYADGSSSASTLNSISMSKSGYRLLIDLQTNRSHSAIFHALEYSMTIDKTKTEDFSFEPLFLGIAYNIDKLDI